MAESIHDVLEDLRDSSLDTRHQGDRFERLVLSFLRTDPEWSSRFSDVWLWSEWPGREGRPDTGVDIVAKHRDREGFAAIQCKFYDDQHRVSNGLCQRFGQFSRCSSGQAAVAIWWSASEVCLS